MCQWSVVRQVDARRVYSGRVLSYVARGDGFLESKHHCLSAAEVIRN